MSGRASYRLRGHTGETYLGLVRRFPLTSIATEDHLEAAQSVIDGLLAQGHLDVGQTLYLEALSDLVASYEDVHHAITPATDADLLRHFMDAHDMSQAALSRATGVPKSSISEVLAGKKPMSRQMMRRFAGHFGVDVSVLAANV